MPDSISFQMPLESDASPSPRSHGQGWRDGRWVAVALLAVQLALFFQFSPQLNVVQVAHRWGVLTVQPDFSDLYVIAAAGAAHKAGDDPYTVNVRDPYQRPYNYPPVWLYLWTSTPTAATVRLVALAMGAFSLAGLLLFVGPLDRHRGWLLGALLCSPPAILAVQRGNTDVLILGLIAFALVLLRRGQGAAGYAILTAATWLKLYPLAALVVLLREPRERLRRIGPAAITGATLAFVVYAGYLGKLFANTPAGGLHSYGSRVPAFWLAFFLPAYGWSIDRVLAGRIFALLAVLLGLLALRLCRGRTPLALATVSGTELDGFRAGAIIYFSTFLLGVSFDYRLVFLLLAVPALVSLAAGAAPGRSWGLAGLILVFATMWPNGIFWKPLLIVKETASWALFFTLTVLLVRTLPPEWGARLRLAQS